jgi:hypothetical protein
MYREVEEYLLQLEKILPGLSVETINRLEELLFVTWSDGKDCGKGCEICEDCDPIKAPKCSRCVGS